MTPSLSSQTNVSHLFPFYPIVSKDDLVALKMRGLSYWVTHEEILEFFKEFKKNERSIILQLGADGMKNGYGVILFESAEDAQEAMAKKQE